MLLALLQLKASPLVLVLYGLFMHCSCTVGRLGGGGAQAWQLGQLLQVGPRKRFLPVLAVKIANCDVLQGAGPDAVDGDSVRVGVGAGAVEPGAVKCRQGTGSGIRSGNEEHEEGTAT